MEVKDIIKQIEELLNRATYNIENKEIYDHGYPEARLVPSDFYENCEKDHKEFYIEKISEIVGDYLDNLYPSSYDEDDDF